MRLNLSVLIPTLNNARGLKHLLEFFKDKEIQVVVVDNKPSKERNSYITILLNCYKERLIYLPQKKNLGFAIAVNHAFKYVNTKWTLILNDDIEFPNDQFINQLYKYAENKKID